MMDYKKLVAEAKTGIDLVKIYPELVKSVAENKLRSITNDVKLDWSEESIMTLYENQKTLQKRLEAVEEEQRRWN